MDYLTVLVSGIIIGLLLNILFAYLSRKKMITSTGEPLATKDDISKVTIELEELKNLYKINKDENEKIQEAEKEFYESIAGEE